MTLHVTDDVLDGDWRRLAACRGMDPDLFFPLRGEAGDLAVATCASCPVRGECSAYALTHGERFGVWGGLSESGRKRLRKAARGQP
jgi:WhiB family redox-sensing transcriptional regulator